MWTDAGAGDKAFCMASKRRAIPLLLALILGACAADGSEPVQRRPPRPTTTIAPTTTTTEAPYPPPRSPPRASRSQAHRSPPAIAPAPPVASNGDCGAWGWVRTRAQSDACWRDEFAKYGGWDVGRMLRITFCESKGDPWSGDRYVGLLQIDRAESTRGNGPANIALGYSIWQRQGYGAWPVCQHR